MKTVLTFSAFDLFVEVEAALLSMNYVRYSADEFIHLAIMTYEHDSIRDLEDTDIEALVDATFINAEECRNQYSGEIPLHEDIYLITLIFCRVRNRLNVELQALADLNHIELYSVFVGKAQVTIVYEAPRGLYR